jgi:hypothetical protein
MLRNRFPGMLAAGLVLSMVAAPLCASAKITSTFYGIVDHVSVNSIKVTNPKTHETLGFALLPKFKQIFSNNGKTTYQMSKIHSGQYVRVIYDQRALGMRHADRIYLLNNASRKMGHQ